jgi:hypothetical protein
MALLCPNPAGEIDNHAGVGPVGAGRGEGGERWGGEGRAVAVGVAGGGGTASGRWKGGWRQRRQTVTRATE